MKRQVIYTNLELRRNPFSHPYWKDINPFNRVDETREQAYARMVKDDNLWAKQTAMLQGKRVLPSLSSM